jgi:hypothetical protein
MFRQPWNRVWAGHSERVSLPDKKKIKEKERESKLLSSVHTYPWRLLILLFSGCQEDTYRYMMITNHLRQCRVLECVGLYLRPPI